MRTLGFRTHVLLVIAGAIGVLASLGRPWYAPAPKPVQADPNSFDVHGPLYGVMHSMRRWLTDPSGVTGWHALGTSGQVLAGAAGLAALFALGCVAAGTQPLVREPLRYLGYVVIGVSAWRIIDPPGTDLELRLGALMAFVCSLVIWVCAQGVANAPSRRRVAPPTYTPPPPPVFEAR
jgi:hypothetical protein